MLAPPFPPLPFLHPLGPDGNRLLWCWYNNRTGVSQGTYSLLVRFPAMPAARSAANIRQFSPPAQRVCCLVQPLSLDPLY